VNEPRSAIYRARAREGAESLYHADAARALEEGYVPSAESWSEALGQQILTVQYVYAPEQTADVRRALAEAAVRPAGASAPAVALPNAATTAAVPSSSSMATGAGIAWLATAALAAFLAFQQWQAFQELTALGQSGLGLDTDAIVNGIGALITAYFAIRCFQRPSRGFWSWSVTWAVVNVGFGVIQVAGGATYWVFFLTIIASGVAGFLSLAARTELARA
jgi:hypothetical protein